MSYSVAMNLRRVSSTNINQMLNVLRVSLLSMKASITTVYSDKHQRPIRYIKHEMTLRLLAVANSLIVKLRPLPAFQAHRTALRHNSSVKRAFLTVWTGHWTRTDKTERLFSSQPSIPRSLCWEPPCFRFNDL